MTKFARSVYCSNWNPEKELPVYCDFIFTSFHVAEEFNAEFKDKAEELLRRIRELNKEVIVDLSPRGLKALDCKNIPEFVKKYSVDYIRYDFGFSEEEIIEGSQCCGTVVNASTIGLDFVGQLKGKVLAIHNFYPRKETGLDKEYFRERNQMFKERNIPVGAFIAGDEELRGPLYEGLPTLEEHRFLKPFVQYLDLLKEVDLILVGDRGLSKKEGNLISDVHKEGTIPVPCNLDEKYEFLYNHVFTNRVDSPKWLIRIKESREYATAGALIEPENCIERKKGSITIDNRKYLRYSGELQIMREDFKADEKINVIGRIADDYLAVLDYIERGKQFQLVKEEE